MLLTTGILLDFMCMCDPKVRYLAHIHSYHSYIGFKKLSQMIRRLAALSVYLCQEDCYRELLKEGLFSENMTLIVCVDELGQLPCPRPYNVIEVSGETLDELHAQLNDMFFDLNGWFGRVQTAVIQSKDMRTLAMIGQEQLINPFLILNGALEVVGYSDENSPTDGSFLKAIERGYAPMALIDRIASEVAPAQRQLSPQGNVFIISPPDGHTSYHRVACFLTEGGDIALGWSGVLIMHCSIRPLSQGILDLLDLFSSTIIYALRNALEPTTAYNVSSECERHLFRLLERRDGEGLTPRELSHHLYLPAQGRFRVFAIELPQMCSKRYALARVSECVKDARCIVFREKIVGVVGFSYQDLDNERFLDNVLEDICAVSRSLGCRIGISMAFAEITGIPSAHIQAIKAIELHALLHSGGTFPAVCRYEDVYLYHIVDACREQLDIRSLCMPQLLELTALDQKNRSDNCKVLRTYLDNNCRSSRTADLLHMHRNNVNYRIKRIEERLGIDLSDVGQRLRLHISFLVLDLLHTKD